MDNVLTETRQVCGDREGRRQKEKCNMEGDELMTMTEINYVFRKVWESARTLVDSHEEKF